MKDNSKWFPFPYVLAIALLLSTVVAFQNYFLSLVSSNKPEFNPVIHLMYPLINYGFWAFLSPVVWTIVKKYRPVPGPMKQRVFMWFVGAVGLAIMHELITNFLFYGLGHLLGSKEITTTFLSKILNLMAISSFSRFLEYWIIFFGLMIWGYYKSFRKQQKKLAEIRGELLEARLEALKAQLHPHFLFNTLNSVSALMTTDVVNAQKVLTNLGKLLRSLFNQDGEHVVSLEEELEYIRYYLQIEQVRFSDRLEVCYNIDPHTKEALVPKLILQPLVENSIIHGIGKSDEGGKITISSTFQDPHLILEVRDNGVGMSEVQSVWDHAGVGLSNTRERLKQLYGDDQNIKVSSNGNHEFKVEIRIIFEKT